MRTLLANDFEIGYLEGWRDGSQIVLIGPERPLFAPNIQIHREELPTESIDEFLREQRSELSGLEGFLLVEHGDRLLGGQRALYHAYDWDHPDQPGIRIRQKQVVATHKATLFTVTCSALVNDWEDFEPAFEMALAKFSWR